MMSEMDSNDKPVQKKRKTLHPDQNQYGSLEEASMKQTNIPQEDVEHNHTTAHEFRFSERPTLDQLRHLQNEFCKERDWEQYHQPRNLLLAMVGEVGEVAELFQWKGEVKVGLPDWSEKDKSRLEEELSDVLIYLLRLSEKCHIDLPKAAMEKIDLNRKKYPVEKVYGSSKKYTEYD